MKFFMSEQEWKESDSSCFHEFQKGDWDEEKMEYWKPDSINLHDDIMYELAFDSLIMKVAPEYDPFGETRITKPQQDEIVHLSAEIGGDVAALVIEADKWVQDTFAEYGVFTILGI